MRTHQSPIRLHIAADPEDLGGYGATKQAAVTFVYYQNARYLHEHKCDHGNTLR
jgi:hypothetical protein